MDLRRPTSKGWNKEEEKGKEGKDGSEMKGREEKRTEGKEMEVCFIGVGDGRP